MNEIEQKNIEGIYREVKKTIEVINLSLKILIKDDFKFITLKNVINCSLQGYPESIRELMELVIELDYYYDDVLNSFCKKKV